MGSQETHVRSTGRRDISEITLKSALKCNQFTYEPSREKTNIVDSASSIDQDQPKHAAQAYQDRHFSPSVDVSGIITLYLYPPETECIGKDQFARTAHADLGRYITQRP